MWRRCCGGKVTGGKCDEAFTVKDLMMHLTALALHEENLFFPSVDLREDSRFYLYDVSHNMWENDLGSGLHAQVFL